MKSERALTNITRILLDLTTLKYIDRYLLNDHVNDKLHVFSDISEKACGIVLYIKSQGGDGNTWDWNCVPHTADDTGCVAHLVKQCHQFHWDRHL